MLLEAEYILPVKWTSDDALPDLTTYLRRLSQWIDVTVIDGSHAAQFEVHSRAWQGLVRHRPVTVTHGSNGKVRSVLSGIAIARHEPIVIADDDIRYERDALVAVVADLKTADLVKPQNYFNPAPVPVDLGSIVRNSSSTATWNSCRSTRPRQISPQ